MEISTIDFLTNVGEARAQLYMLYSDFIFNNLSEDNPFFQSEHELESQRLNTLRLKLMDIKETLIYANKLMNTSSSGWVR